METEPRWSDTQKIVALLVVISFIVIVITWMFYPPKGDPGAIAVLNTLVGSLGTGFGMILSYFFASNKNSAAKDETIAKMAATSSNGNGTSATIPAKTVNVETETTNINTEK